MSCGCAGRARKAMISAGYDHRRGKWYDRDGHFVIDDEMVEEDHIKLLPLAAQQVFASVLEEARMRLEEVRGHLFG